MHRATTPPRGWAYPQDLPIGGSYDVAAAASLAADRMFQLKAIAALAPGAVQSQPHALPFAWTPVTQMLVTWMCGGWKARIAVTRELSERSLADCHWTSVISRRWELRVRALQFTTLPGALSIHRNWATLTASFCELADATFLCVFPPSQGVGLVGRYRGRYWRTLTWYVCAFLLSNSPPVHTPLRTC